MKKIFILMAVLCNTIGGLATIIHVPEDYATIQEGIDAAENGDTVLVAPGEYWESPVIEDKNILLASADGPENTTIRGYMMIRGESVDTTCVLQGFAITKDDADPWVTPSLLRIRYASPLIVGNIIRNNVCWDFGAGIQCWGGAAIIRANIIRDNTTRSKAGGILGPQNGIIEGNVIFRNRVNGVYETEGNAGGIAISSGVMRYNLVEGNTTLHPYYGCGGGILKGSAANSQVYNNTIVDNSASTGGNQECGGGIYIAVRADDVAQVFKNNIIAFNHVGGGVFAIIEDSAEIDWDYNLVFGNEPYDYEGIEPGPHDIQEDPLFVDRFSGDYSLLPNSPCIDAGDPDFPLDPDGTRADIGAYYFDQTVGIDDGKPSGPYQFQLRQNYPNPFNAQTIISYALSENSVVSLMIFSIRGQFIKSIVNKAVQEPGEHQYIWDGNDKNGKMVSTGIYFYELYVNDHRESKAMIMIK